MGISALRIDSQLQIPWNQDAAADTLFLTSSGTPDVEASIAPDLWSRYPAPYSQARPSDGVFVQADYKVTFSSATFTAFNLKPGDRAYWDGLTCPTVVLSATRNDMLRYWDLTCRDLVLSYDLRTQCTVYRPTVAADSSGLRSVSFTSLYADVPCAIEPQGWSQEVMTDDQLIRRQRYTVYLLKTHTVPAVALKAGDVLDVSSVRYEVIGQEQVSEYDTLITVTVERKDP